MNFEEHAAKPLLQAAGIAIPEGALAQDAGAAAEIAARLGPVVIKAQVPSGKRGKAGGIKPADTPAAAARAAEAMLGMRLGGHRVERVLVEGRVEIARELYAAVLNDPASRSPLVMFSTRGGMDIEEVAAAEPAAVRRLVIDIASGFAAGQAEALLAGLDLGPAAGPPPRF
jgi:succinyl-CoA synthetase beta subunit